MLTIPGNSVSHFLVSNETLTTTNEIVRPSLGVVHILHCISKIKTCEIVYWAIYSTISNNSRTTAKADDNLNTVCVVLIAHFRL